MIRELGVGSAGKVYLVQHPDLNIKYAVKVLHKAMSDNPNFIEQFKREAEVLLRFTHEGCVQLRDFGRLPSQDSTGGRYYMATDYCEGETLKQRLKTQGALDPAYAIALLMQLLDVLAAAHARGIIHRDIKPDNIIIEPGYKGKEVVKVLDFGIAKLLELDQPKIDSGIEDLTVGTPGYMSPEQAYGEGDLDHRVDIYAAAVVAYEMFTGQPPYKGASPEEVLIAHVTGEPEPFAGKYGFPGSLEKLVFRGMEKARVRRYPTAEDFRKHCEMVLNEISGKNLTRATPDANAEPVEEEAVFLPDLLPPKERVPYPSSAPAVERILILDDEDTLLTLTTHILQSAGYEVFPVRNVSETYRFLVNEKVDLLITDVQMPDMPGWKVCKMLKSALPNLKVILFSTLDTPTLEKLTEQSGADGWISKMTPPKDWIPQVAAVLAKPGNIGR